MSEGTRNSAPDPPEADDFDLLVAVERAALLGEVFCPECGSTEVNTRTAGAGESVAAWLCGNCGAKGDYAEVRVSAKWLAEREVEAFRHGQIRARVDAEIERTEGESDDSQ